MMVVVVVVVVVADMATWLIEKLQCQSPQHVVLDALGTVYP